jgi:hypothetical protein
MAASQLCSAEVRRVVRQGCPPIRPVCPSVSHVHAVTTGDASKISGARLYHWIVRNYQSEFRESAKAERKWFANLPTLRDAINWAALARFEGGRKLEHQWRLRNSKLQRARLELLAAEEQKCGL